VSRSHRTAAILGLVVAGTPAVARAAGTALDVQSARGTGMASAMTAAVDDSSAIFYNAAGIAQGRALDAQIGITPIVAGFKFKSTAGNETSVPFYVVPPINAYASGGVTDNISLGIGFFSPYGLKVKWPTGWEGRTISTRSALATYYVNPTVAYHIGPIRIGAGLQVVRGTVELARDIRFGTQDGSISLGAGAWGVGGNGGIQIDSPKKWLTFGVHYRSAVRLAFKGDAHFDNVPGAFQSTIHDQRATSSLVNPDQLAFGIAARPLETLVLDLDVVWLGWAKLKNVNIDFPYDASGTLATTEAKNWRNTANVHLGGELSVAREWRVRAGALYDPSPSRADTLAPDIPDANRLNLAAGVGWAHPTGVYVDLGYQFLILFSKDSTFPTFPGTYSGNVNIVGLSVGFAYPPHDKL
jgi:long-chain fatty acid transport protein